jgi:hypothetical protein
MIIALNPATILPQPVATLGESRCILCLSIPIMTTNFVLFNNKPLTVKGFSLFYTRFNSEGGGQSSQIGKRLQKMEEMNEWVHDLKRNDS